MSEPRATTGFEFYESLRYFLPGVLVVFLAGYLGVPSCVATFSLGDKLAWGVLIGFLIHSFGMYKCMPGATPMRQEFHEKVKELLGDVAGVYVRCDTVMLMVATDVRQYCRKYFALGAFKLDMAFVLAIFVACYGWNALRSMARANALSVGPIGVMLLILAAMYVVADDGLNDLRRAFNVALIALLALREKPELKRTLELIASNEARLIAGERRFLHPKAAVWSAVTWLPRWIRDSIEMTRDQG